MHLSPFLMQIDKQEPICLENLKNLCDTKIKSFPNSVVYLQINQ